MLLNSKGNWMKIKILWILFFVVFAHENYCEDLSMNDLENQLFNIGVTCWVNENDNHYYTLNFIANNEIDFSYFSKKDKKFKIYRKGTYEIENNIVKINFTKVLYNILNFLDEPFIEELTIELEIKIKYEDIINLYTDEIFIKQISGINIFEDSNKNEILKFNASRLLEER